MTKTKQSAKKRIVAKATPTRSNKSTNTTPKIPEKVVAPAPVNILSACEITHDNEFIYITTILKTTSEQDTVKRMLRLGAYWQFISCPPPYRFCNVYAHKFRITVDSGMFVSRPHDAGGMAVATEEVPNGFQKVAFRLTLGSEFQKLPDMTDPTAKIHAVLSCRGDGQIEISFPTEWEVTSVPTTFPELAYELPGQTETIETKKLIDLVREVNIQFDAVEKTNTPDRQVELKLTDDGRLELAVTTVKYLR